MSAAKFITFEGVDGAGKSTHLTWFAEVLRQRGREVVVTREPGGTPVGERLREILLSQTMHAETEALLMFAGRLEHIECVIKPALNRGAWVISDRFSDASFAYQGGGRGVIRSKLEQLEQWVHQDFQPDLTLLFDIPVEGIALILPIDHFCDMFRSATNVLGNALATSVGGKWEKD